MFQFPGFAQNPYFIQGLVPRYDNQKPKTMCCHTVSEFQLSEVGFPIQKSSDQSLFAAPQGLSQRTTSFIASQCQGIHRTPLRHLIALMIDAHPSAEVAPVLGAMGHRRKKTSLLHDLTRAARSGSSHNGDTPRIRPSHSRDRMTQAGQIASSRYRTTCHRPHGPKRQTLTFSCGTASWWSQTGSNRRPHACKARALPAELWPQSSGYVIAFAVTSHEGWWAWEDLNFRPHAYQARALTN